MTTEINKPFIHNTILPNGTHKNMITWANPTWTVTEIEDLLNDLPKFKFIPEKENLNLKEKDIKIPPLSKLYKYPPLSKYEGLEGTLPTRAGTTYVGVEFELERVDKKEIPKNVWRIEEDHSLKDQGLEFISKPIQFKYLEVEVNRLFQGIVSYNVSSRCSTHVHLNIRDFNTEEVMKLTLLYMIFERSLYRVSGDRWNNNFCVPLHFYPEQVRKIYLDSKQGYFPEHWYKYFGFNLSPIFGGESSKIGTIEFRHMRGYSNTEQLITWINLIVSLKITAKSMSLSDILNHIETMNTTSGYYWLAQTTFKDFYPHITNQATFKQDVESCISQTKTVILPKKEVNSVVNLYKGG